MHRIGSTSGCGGAPLPIPRPTPCSSPLASAPRPAGPRGPTSPFPPLPLGPLPAPSPWSGRTPSPLPSGPCRGSRPLSPAPLLVPLTPLSLQRPSPCPWSCPRPLTAPWPAPCALMPPALAPCSCPCARPLALLLAPASLPCPCPFPALCPASGRPLLAPWPAPCACPPLLPMASVPCPCPCPLYLPCAPWPVPCDRPWALPLSPPVPRSALSWLATCPTHAPSPPSWITRRASRRRCSCGSVMPRGVPVGARGGRAAASPWERRPWAGTAWGGWCGCGWAWCGRGTWRPPCPPLRLRRLPARRSGPARSPSAALAAYRRPRCGRPGPWHGLPGPQSQLLVHPGTPSGAGRQGPRPERRGRPPWRARAPGPAVRGRRGLPGAARPAARPAGRPPPAAAPRAPRGSPPCISGRRGSGSGSGGGGGRPNWQRHRSPTSLLSW